MPPFDEALQAAVELLRALPRDRGEVTTSKARFEDLRRAHPATSARLAVDRRPGWPSVEYDVLLEHPGGGTVGVTWRPDDGTPWIVEYAEHWAANLVVTVGDDYEKGVSLQEALLVLKLAADPPLDLMERIVEEKLVALCLDEDPPEVSAGELQQAADAYRAAHGLTEPGSVRRQLDEWGIPLERFEQMLRHALQRRKLRERVAAGQVEAYFEAHAGELERLRVVVARASARGPLDRLLSGAAGGGVLAALAAEAGDAALDGLGVEVGARFVSDLPGAFLAQTPPRGLVAPFAVKEGWCAGEVLARVPAALDAATRAEIERRLFRGFLKAKRDTADVRWRWL